MKTHLVGVPAVSLRGKVVGPGQTLQVLGQFDGLAVCNKETGNNQRQKQSDAGRSLRTTSRWTAGSIAAGAGAAERSISRPTLAEADKFVLLLRNTDAHQKEKYCGDISPPPRLRGFFRAHAPRGRAYSIFQKPYKCITESFCAPPEFDVGEL